MYASAHRTHAVLRLRLGQNDARSSGHQPLGKPTRHNRGRRHGSSRLYGYRGQIVQRGMSRHISRLYHFLVPALIATAPQSAFTPQT